MDIVYDPNCLEHYGVGHDKGGHSGRYPWGSGAKKKYIKKVQKIKRSWNVRTYQQTLSAIKELNGTSILASSLEIRNAYDDYRKAGKMVDEAYTEAISQFRKDTKFKNDMLSRLTKIPGNEKYADAFESLFWEGEDNDMFEQWTEEHPGHPAVIKYENACQMCDAIEKKYTQTIVNQFSDANIKVTNFSDGSTFFYGLPAIRDALTQTLDELDKEKGGKA